MELNDTLRIPLAPPVVREAFEDLALLRASFDHCESFVKLADGEFALTITVPLGRCAPATTCVRMRPPSRAMRKVSRAACSISRRGPTGSARCAARSNSC